MKWKATIRTSLVLAVIASLVPGTSAQKRIERVVAELNDGDLYVATTPVSLPLPMGMEGGFHQHRAVYPPIVHVELPISGYMYGVEYELVDSAGQEVPRDVLHHFNLIDPQHREMFLPIARRVFAAGQETGSYKMPKTLMGIPFEAGDLLVVSVMLHNPTDRAYHGVSLRLRIKFVKTGLPWPLVDVIPFQMDTLFPTGDKSFDLPPGKSSWSWEGKPVTKGRIVAVGAHLHPFSVSIYMEDLTTAEIVWTGRPEYDEDGSLLNITRGEFYGTFGILIDPQHTYRVTAEYNNTSGRPISAGGMGVIAGIIIPSDPEFGFSANTSDSLYAVDYAHFMRESITME